MLEITLPDYARESIVRFIKDFVGERSVVVGISGGLDSAVVASLCAQSLGKDKVVAVHMPDQVTPPEDTEDARNLASALGIEYREISIGDLVEPMAKRIGIKNLIALGNLKARIRMLILYGIANQESRLVVGTSNKSELLVGYFTKYGDGASDLSPIGDLYKTQVRILAERIGIPEKIRNKKPSATLLPGQTDEEEIGVTYEMLDRILYGMELGYPPEKVAKFLDMPMETVEKIYGMHERSRHKRVMLYIPKIGIRTVNTDWRE